ncbi:DUF6625 family protein [Ligilactobacillus cholophilus]|uniref:DUF6625 family protein n=1 Tax=Ligilactobacillus cholophilus TaxID=3050131 RepID=UPI0025AFE438|nr:DUF6625 family protein [Ligilactobacillus cholophilus]
MKSVAIIIPYFSKEIPREFPVFLKSCSYNSTITWILFTNWQKKYIKQYKVPKNVKIKKINLKFIENKVQKILKNKNIRICSPYKLCDYKPMYGELFQEYLKEFDYWGYSDIDVIYGDLRKYISKPLSENYDRIGTLGHFTLFRNCIKVNQRYRLPYKIKGKEESFENNVVTTQEIMCFDERCGINLIYDQNNFSTYSNPNLLAEIRWTHLDLLITEKKYASKDSVWLWENGKTIYFYKNKNKIYSIEKGYFHFQKRKHFNQFINCRSQYNKFIIGTNGYQIIKSKLDVSNLFNYNKSPYLKRLRYFCSIIFLTPAMTKKHIGKLYLPIRYLINRTIKERKFDI